jgi:4-amino-4-deoxy-L-arabinose transferase-like glycosyltransferase
VKKVILIIVIISFFLRLYKVGQNPTILNRDEAALAYNAYLLKETGTDEWQQKWPLTLQSFGDYKLVGYPLLLIPVYTIFGMADWTVRFPSVIAGAVLLVLSYAFGRSMQFDKKVSLIFSFLLATTPVFFFYSRIAYEANVALMIFVGSLTLLFSVRPTIQKYVADGAAAILMTYAVFTYNTPLLLLPFVIMLIPWWRGLKQWKQWLPVFLALSLVALAAGTQLLSVSSQKSSITIFQDENIWKRSVEHSEKFNGISRTLFGNRFVVYCQVIAENYLKSLSPVFLVEGKGGHPWHSVPNTGHILNVVYVLAIIGILSTVWSVISNIKKTEKSEVRRSLLLLFLFFVSWLPAVVTVDAPHATRSLFALFLLILFSTIGLSTLYVDKKHGRFLLTTTCIVIGLMFTNYLRNYFFTYPNNQQAFKPGFNSVIKDLSTRHTEGDIAIVDDEGYHYILLAWYLKLSPTQYFDTVVRQLPNKIGFRYGERVDRFHFIASPNDRSEAEKALLQWKKGTWEVVE